MRTSKQTARKLPQHATIHQFPKHANPLAELFAIIREDSPAMYEELCRLFQKDREPLVRKDKTGCNKT